MNPQLRALLLVSQIVIDAVREAGPDGVPESIVFLALENHGCTLKQWEQISSILIDAGRIRRENFRLYEVA